MFKLHKQNIGNGTFLDRGMDFIKSNQVLPYECIRRCVDESQKRETPGFMVKNAGVPDKGTIHRL